jgi:hypothetical protein
MKFLEDLTKLEKTTDTKEVIKKTKEIIETYLLESSTSEINISGKSKEKIIQGYTFQRENDSTWVFHTDPVELFQEIKKMVLGEMYHDPWRRFIRTPIVKSFIQKYQNDSSVCSPDITESFNYQEDYFDHPFIFDQDFKFAEMLLKDNFHWKVNLILIDSVNWVQS